MIHGKGVISGVQRVPVPCLTTHALVIHECCAVHDYVIDSVIHGKGVISGVQRVPVP